jgi:hypothetical protein
VSVIVKGAVSLSLRLFFATSTASLFGYNLTTFQNACFLPLDAVNMITSASAGRTLLGAPILLQDWDREAEEGAAQVSELFLDLLPVPTPSLILSRKHEHFDSMANSF